MPREYSKRGGKKEKQKKRRHHEATTEDTQHGTEWHEEPARKRARSNEPEDAEYMQLDAGYSAEDYAGGDEYYEEELPGGQDEFYGLLNEDDQGYFKRVESMLEIDQFESPEDKDLFLSSVWREADGKELKLACSQSCSRVLERLVKVSKPVHLKKLFRQFSNHFLFLVQHRFASHCCETLFLAAAPAVTQELISPLEPDSDPAEDPDNVYVSMENLFLYTVNELAENMGYLMTDQFASHPLRILLVVLSGKPLEDAATVSVPPGKQKSQSSQGASEGYSKELGKEWRTVPSAFHEAAQKVTTNIIGGLDTHYLRTLTTNPLASKILQRMLELELIQQGKTKARDPDSLLRRLIPDESPEVDSETGRFLKGILYDVAGSRLLEVVVQCAPAKIFKPLYRSFFHPQLAAIAKNDIASFVLIRILDRLGADDLQDTIEALEPDLPVLITRRRDAVVRALIERCRIRNLDIQPIVSALEQAYGSPGPTTLRRLLHLDTETEAAADPQPGDMPDSNPGATQHHARRLACTLLAHSDSASAYLGAALLATPTPTLLTLARDRHASFVLQTALADSSLSAVTTRALVQALVPHTAALAIDPVASHIVDALWPATDGAAFFLKERIVTLLAADEAELRATLPGRAIWRNWRVELFGRRRVEWIAKAKGRRSDAEFAGRTGGVRGAATEHKTEAVAEHRASGKDGAGAEASSKEAAVEKTAIEKARERWAAKQKGGGKRGPGGGGSRTVRVQ